MQKHSPQTFREKFLYYVWWPLMQFRRRMVREVDDFVDGRIIPYLRIGPSSMSGFVVTMFCPHCKWRLSYGGIECYETLSDHVFAPNDEPPLRLKFECFNPTCSGNAETGVFYGMDGSKYGELRENDKVLWAAIGSWEWWYDRKYRHKR